MNKNDLNRIYSSITANSAMKERIIENAENPVTADIPKRRSPALKAAAAISLLALTAVIAVTSARFGSDSDIVADPLTTSETEASIIKTPETAAATSSSEIPIPETAAEELPDVPLKITVGEKIYMLADNDTELLTILFNGYSGYSYNPILGNEVPGGSGLHYFADGKNPNLLGLESDGEIHFYRYHSPVKCEGNMLEAMLRTSGDDLYSFEVMNFNYAYEEEWESTSYCTVAAEENTNLLVDTELTNIIGGLSEGGKFEYGRDYTVDDLSVHITEPQRYYLVAKYAGGEVMAFPISPESNVISAFCRNYEMSEDFIGTFLGTRYMDSVAQDERYYSNEYERLQNAVSAQDGEVTSPAYDPNPKPAAEPRQYQASFIFSDKNGDPVNGLRVTCQAIKYTSGVLGYDFDNDRGGYMDGAALTCGDKPTVRTLTEGAYLVTASDMMVNSDGVESKRNEMQFTIEINADSPRNISFDLPWDRPTPDELNAVDRSKTVIRLLDENGSPLFGYWVILRPEGFDGSNLAEGYSGAWGGYVIGATDKNGKAVWHCPIEGKYTVTAYSFGVMENLASDIEEEIERISDEIIMRKENIAEIDEKIAYLNKILSEIQRLHEEDSTAVSRLKEELEALNAQKTMLTEMLEEEENRLHNFEAFANNEKVIQFMSSLPMNVEITNADTVTTFEFKENGKPPVFDESDFIPE